jgi:hypothetical protein
MAEDKDHHKNSEAPRKPSREKAEGILRTLYRFDTSRLPEDRRKKVQDQVNKIRARVLQYLYETRPKLFKKGGTTNGEPHC